MKYTPVINADRIEIKDSSGVTRVKMGVLEERSYRLYVPGVSKHWETVHEQVWFHIHMLRKEYWRLKPDIWVYKNTPAKGTQWMVVAYNEAILSYGNPPKTLELYNLLLGE